MSPDQVGHVYADRVWKRFRADAHSRDLKDHFRRLRQRHRRGWRWVLRDVSLDIEPGGSLALIGANGSGKSTLLKVLAGVMDPYAGRVGAVGRTGALIEVRAGIHQELSGRENIFLAGSLLGLPRRLVAERFDEIVDFAGLADSIDRQAKFYSTGMQMRLGFGVAAYLEPDILFVDEVLAVGDSAFQQRCLDRIRQVLAMGTTLVFVSHDLAAVEAMCRDAVWLRDASVAARGTTHEVLADYRRWVDELATGGGSVAGVVRLVEASVVDGEGAPFPRSHHPLEVRLTVEGDELHDGTVLVGISEGTASPTVLTKHALRLRPGRTEVRCTVADLPLPRGRFYVWAGVFQGQRDLLPWQPAASFDVVGPALEWVPPGIVRLAPVHVEAEWASVGGTSGDDGGAGDAGDSGGVGAPGPAARGPAR
ncbi:MAG: ABC transporter ATP-binding protein [Acidimicrobiia bacterium]